MKRRFVISARMGLSPCSHGRLELSFVSNSTTLGSFQSAAPTSEAAIRPSGAMTNVAGIPSVENTGGAFVARKKVMGQFLLSRNCLTVEPESSVETHRKVTSFR